MEEKKRFEGYKRPTVLLTNEEHKKIKIFCAEREIYIQDFLTYAALYCLENEIAPEDEE